MWRAASSTARPRRTTSGFGRMVSPQKDFIGRMMGEREALKAGNRDVLVGLKPVEPDEQLRAGAHLLTRGAVPSLEADQGYVTSVAYSPMLGSGSGWRCSSTAASAMARSSRSMTICAMPG